MLVIGQTLIVQLEITRPRTGHVSVSVRNIAEPEPMCTLIAHDPEFLCTVLPYFITCWPPVMVAHVQVDGPVRNGVAGRLNAGVDRYGASAPIAQSGYNVV